MQPDGRTLLTMTQAAKLLGDDKPGAGRRLRRRLLAKQRQTRRRILVAAGGSGAGKRYLVRIQTLVRWCPELTPDPDVTALPRIVADALDGLHELIRSNARRTNAHGANFRRVFQALGAAGIRAPD